eukprot:1379876-Prymnesium_polylepis.1
MIKSKLYKIEALTVLEYEDRGERAKERGREERVKSAIATRWGAGGAIGVYLGSRRNTGLPMTHSSRPPSRVPARGHVPHL